MTATDIKYALRLLVKSPYLTLLTIVVLTGGLAISIYTFSFLNTMVYKALPLPEGSSVVRVAGGTPGNEVPLYAYDLARIRPAIDSLREIGAYRSAYALFGDQDSNRDLMTTYAEWNMFRFTRSQPVLGRGFLPEDALAGAEPVAVIGHAIWRSVFLSDPAIIGEWTDVNGVPTRIVGVMPEGFAFPINSQMWLPLGNEELDPPADSTDRLFAYARLGPGVSNEEAAAQATALLKQVRAERTNDERVIDVAAVSSFKKAEMGAFGPRVFAVLNGLAIAILLLVCANVGNLLLARTNERVREISIRLSLGAPRARVILQMTLENLIVCVVGGLLAVYLASRALDFSNGFFAALLEGRLPYWWRWGIDGSTVIAAGLFVLSTILLVSVLPAYGVTNTSPATILQDGTYGARGLNTGKLSRGLIAMEVALISCIMIVGSIVASVAYRTANFDWGIDTENLYMAQIRLNGDAYDTEAEQLAFYDDVLVNLRESAGVEAAEVNVEPGPVEFAPGAVDAYSGGRLPSALLIALSAEESAVGLRLIQGRNFDSRDSATAPKTVIVNRALAARYWPDASALDRQIEVVDGDGTREQRVVVGVVGDVTYNPLATDDGRFAALYVPLPQKLMPVARIVVRHPGTIEQVRNTLVDALSKTGPGLPPLQVTSYQWALDLMTRVGRAATNLFIGCGFFAVLLALTGIYGLSSNSVVNRSHEIGLRQALGASNGNIVVLFLGQGVRQLAIGLTISGLVSIAALVLISRYASPGAGLVFGVSLAVVAAVSALILISVFLSVRVVLQREPSSALRHT